MADRSPRHRTDPLLRPPPSRRRSSFPSLPCAPPWSRRAPPPSPRRKGSVRHLSQVMLLDLSFCSHSCHRVRHLSRYLGAPSFHRPPAPSRSAGSKPLAAIL